jgi:hypothetical protein
MCHLLILLRLQNKFELQQVEGLGCHSDLPHCLVKLINEVQLAQTHSAAADAAATDAADGAAAAALLQL